MIVSFQLVVQMRKCSAVHIYNFWMINVCTDCYNQHSLKNRSVFIYAMQCIFKWQFSFLYIMCALSAMRMHWIFKKKNERNSSYCTIFGDEFVQEFRFTLWVWSALVLWHMFVYESNDFFQTVLFSNSIEHTKCGK